MNPSYITGGLGLAILVILIIAFVMYDKGKGNAKDETRAMFVVGLIAAVGLMAVSFYGHKKAPEYL
jgi:hypothetical protein